MCLAESIVLPNLEKVLVRWQLLVYMSRESCSRRIPTSVFSLDEHLDILCPQNAVACCSVEKGRVYSWSHRLLEKSSWEGPPEVVQCIALCFQATNTNNKVAAGQCWGSHPASPPVLPLL